jgi:UDP-N-acetylglucosamine--N-acetylmuramyl-(pentapeptide) pyrophosphoryl-undecaprenol N-acetylglucosamine transferase
MQPIMILAGGTGGHVFPALAVAKQLREYGIPVVWVGTDRGIEAKVVPNAGFTLIKMSVQGLRRKGVAQYLRAPFIIARAMWESLKILLHYKPIVLLGMGGFVSGPCAMMGFIMRKPLIIHEQNAVLGLTNKILSPMSKIMFTGFPLQEKHKNAKFIGNPVRKELLNIENPEKRFAERTGHKRILVVGGSQGSSALNSVVPAAINLIKNKVAIDVWHQTGSREFKDVEDRYTKNQLTAKVNEFIDDIDQAYAWADLIICRSGAMTLAEIATVGVGSILVPYPYAVDDHQTANAKTLVATEAAYLIAENDLHADSLAKLLEELMNDDSKLIAMASAAKRSAASEASKVVAHACIALAGYEVLTSNNERNI